MTERTPDAAARLPRRPELAERGRHAAEIRLDPRSLLHLLFHGSKAIEVVETAERLGILDALEPGPVRLDELAARIGAPELRLYKFLDCLESLQLVTREQPEDRLGSARYRAIPGLREAARAVLAPDSQERDRDRIPWRDLHGLLPELLRGEASVPRATFDWPPSEDQVASFEASMRAGIGPFREAFLLHAERLFAPGARWLDVGGGDGSLAAAVLHRTPGLRADVFNLPTVMPLVEALRDREGLHGRLGGVAGDFLGGPLPAGYDVLSFVRVLHDWPAEVARELIEKAFAALPPGGRIVVSEEFRTPGRLAAQFFWTWFLVGVDGCVSRLREVEYYLEALRQAGFTEIQLLPGPMEIVTAVRPRAA